MGEMRGSCRVQWECLRERKTWKGLGVGGRIILKWNFQV
jgi:hypothetical protein